MIAAICALLGGCSKSDDARGSAGDGSATTTVVTTAPSPVATSGNERSAEHFCATMRAEKERILAQMNHVTEAGASSGDETIEVLAGLGASVQAIGELQTYFAKLAKVAPPEIQTETEIVAEAFADQLDAAGEALDNPLAGLGSMLLTGLTTSGQLNTVNQYALDHCGESI